MKYRTIYLLPISLLAFGVGCKLSAGKLQDAGSKIASSTGQYDESIRIELVEVYHEAQWEVRSWERNYSDYIGFKKGSETDPENADVRRYLWLTYELNTGKISFKVKGLEEKLNNGNSLLQKQVEAYLKAIKSLLEVAEQVKSYYKKTNYKDDALLKGKALHTQLTNAFVVYFKAEEQVNDMLEALEKKELEDMLIESKDKRPVKYKALLVYKSARVLLDATQAKGEKPDTAAIIHASASYEKELEKLQVLLAKEKGHASKAPLLTNAENFFGACNNLLITSKNLTRTFKQPRVQREKIEDLRTSLVNDYNSVAEYFSYVRGIEL
ncbi:DUF3829 domain-containing protein [Paraflavitalea sp. CAU 1676]|uniref:DUF3829 domain-containing protein n=1 Tax=Paraflavitalea sp. CAU 1676 TaxID=3032598 RepID=UPI0023DB58EF|nr:DUF3829 domain-containing protein [Paraflavitalea sp. CAU 1676]MDF2190566.1 DUF3829 domain-containing protein [Paraflavitalea sp. CAU 1676]